jgi:hypothetical protein
VIVVNRQRLYARAKDFFEQNGNAVMKLGRSAAAEACRAAAHRGLVVVKLEGGIWKNGTFEARLDAIWDGIDPPTDNESASKNNLSAAEFIQARDAAYNAFIITVASVAGYQPR